MLPLPPIFAMLFVWFAIGRYALFVSDAYVQALVVQVSPQVAGFVTQVLVDDDALVKKGAPLNQPTISESVKFIDDCISSAQCKARIRVREYCFCEHCFC